MISFIYFSVILLELIFLLSFIVFVVFLIYSNIKGSPYVPTKNKELDLILKEAKLKKGQYFYELGSGNGKVVRKAVKNYYVKGVGIDINPILVFLSKVLSKLQRIKKIEFKCENILNTDISKANVVYLFLLPKLLDTLLPKLEKELMSNTIVISHGFKIDAWKNKLFKTIKNKPFPTYFYRK